MGGEGGNVFHTLNSLNSWDVNCVALSVTTQSTTPKRANSSFKETYHAICGRSFAFQNFRPFCVAVNDNEVEVVIHMTCEVYGNPLPRLDRFWPRFARNCWRFSCECGSFTWINHVCYVRVHVWPIDVTADEAFSAFFPGCPMWKSCWFFFCRLLGITTLSLYKRTSLQS